MGSCLAQDADAVRRMRSAEPLGLQKKRTIMTNKIKKRNKKTVQAPPDGQGYVISSKEDTFLRNQVSWLTGEMLAIAKTLRLPPDKTLKDLSAWAVLEMRTKKK
jgi:hypothetical protein